MNFGGNVLSRCWQKRYPYLIIAVVFCMPFNWWYFCYSISIDCLVMELLLINSCLRFYSNRVNEANNTVENGTWNNDSLQLWQKFTMDSNSWLLFPCSSSYWRCGVWFLTVFLGASCERMRRRTFCIHYFFMLHLSICNVDSTYRILNKLWNANERKKYLEFESRSLH